MSAPDPAFQLAPAGIARCAAWPAESLEAFGDPALAESAEHGGARWDRAYGSTLERERAALWSRTLDDPSFAKALALSSPSAHARATAAAAYRSAPRNRGMRRAEHTLYRYLARAASRPTPHGLWAGVAELRFARRSRVEAAPPRWRFTPDLRPFQALARGLASRPEYHRRSRWRLNATLHLRGDGEWAFLARLASGRLEQRTLAGDAWLPRALAVLADMAPMRLHDLAAEVARRGAWPAGTRRRVVHLLDALARGGALVGALDLAVRFETPWEALDRTAADLTGPDRQAWRAATKGLAEDCEHLAGAVSALTPDALLRRLDAARERVAALARALELPQQLVPPQILRCDLGVPWRVTLGEAERRALLGALSDHHRCWSGATSPAAVLREAWAAGLAEPSRAGASVAAAAWAALSDPPELLPRVWPAPGDAGQAGLDARLRAWEACLAAAGAEVVLAPGPHYTAAPAGCLIAGLSGAREVDLRGVGDNPRLAVARRGTGQDDGGVAAWVSHQLERHAAARGVSLVELRAPFESNPNVLAGPALAQEVVAPWGGNDEGLSLAGARLRTLDAGGRAVLALAADDRPRVVLAASAAHLQAWDPLAQVLLCTGHQESPGHAGRAVDIPTAFELDRPRYTPRVRLPGGALLRRRRSVLAACVAALARARGSERFRAWQRLAKALGWPERLRAFAGGAEPVALHRDSPLAVEALFKGVGPTATMLVVEEAAPACGLPVPGRGAHSTEVAIAFASVATPARGDGSSTR